MQAEDRCRSDLPVADFNEGRRRPEVAAEAQIDAIARTKARLAIAKFNADDALRNKFFPGNSRR